MGAGAEVVGCRVRRSGLRQRPSSAAAAWARELAGAMLGQEMTNEGSGQTFDQLQFFMAARRWRKRWIFRFETDTGRGKPGGAVPSPTCRLSGFRRRSGCVPAEPYPPLKHVKLRAKPQALDNKKPTASLIIPLLIAQLLSGFARTTTQEYEDSCCRSAGGSGRPLVVPGWRGVCSGAMQTGDAGLGWVQAAGAVVGCGLVVGAFLACSG